MIFTLQDVIDHGLDYLGGNPSDQALRDVKRAALAAYKDLVNAFNWSFLYKQGRIYTTASFPSFPIDFNPPPGAPTIQYQGSGGTYPRQVTITGDVWPDWAGDGYIRVGLVDYRVDKRISSTVLTLDPMVKPAADMPAGTGFTLYQDTYLLPEDFVSQDQAVYELNFGGMVFVHPKEWLFSTRYKFTQSQPWLFSITGDQKYPGRMVMRVAPVPYEQRSIDFIYKHRPRMLETTLINVGTVTGTMNTNTLTGSGTSFDDSYEGCVIRLSSNTKTPTSYIMGSNIATFESIITHVNSGTSLTLRDNLDANYTGVGYAISDPIDFEQGVMLQCYLRCVEKHIGMSRILKDKPSAARQYAEALAEAKAADSRCFMGKRPSRMNGRYFRLRDHMIPGGNTPDGILGY